MKLRSILLLGALCLGLPLQTFAQKSTLSKANLAKTFAFYKNPNPSLNHENYFESMAAEMHLSASSKMVLMQETVDQSGTRHFRYQQFYQGVPVYGSRYILHEKEGRVVTATGQFTPEISIATQPGINASTAQAFAKLAMKAKLYRKEAVEPVLCLIDPAFPKSSESIVLAYQVDLYSLEPFDKRRFFVDASSGKIIRELPLLLEEGVPSTAKTRYYGIRNIITDSIAPQEFVLRDPTRGEGIFIYNNDGSNFTNTSSAWDLTNAEKDEVALDAHFCTQEYYDMMLADFNWQGQDGNGKALNVVVHIGDYANAFWDGESTQFADGDCIYGPLTTLEVVGHEFTHGMIDYTSNLVYASESGAINESLADMFGKMLERKTDPANFSWSLGHSFLLSPDAEPFRVMDNPNVLQMPAFYKGQYWDDINDVHTNSSIGNLWFSMIVDGKQGTNEIGVNFDVPALGMDKAGQIIFEVNRNYFIENSDYNDFYLYSIEVASDIYGANSTEVQAVMEAWKAVGLPNEPNGAFDLSIVGNGFSLANYCDIGAYLPVSFKIVNSSSVAYDPSMMAKLTLTSGGFPSYELVLTNPIGPGEVFDIQVNNWIQITQPGYIFVDANLEITDDNSANNADYSVYNILSYLADDLSLLYPKRLEHALLRPETFIYSFQITVARQFLQVQS